MSGIIGTAGSKSGIIGLLPNMPYFSARESSSQTIAHSAVELIDEMEEIVDTHNAWNGSQFTIPSGHAGYYHITGTVEFHTTNNDIGGGRAQFRKDSTVIMEQWAHVTYGSGGWNYPIDLRHLQVNLHTVEYLNSGEQLMMYAAVMSGSGNNVTLQKSSLTAFKLGS